MQWSSLFPENRFVVVLGGVSTEVVFSPFVLELYRPNTGWFSLGTDPGPWDLTGATVIGSAMEACSLNSCASYNPQLDVWTRVSCGFKYTDIINMPLTCDQYDY